MAKHSASAPSSPRGRKHKKSNNDEIIAVIAVSNVSHNKVIENVDSRYVLSFIESKEDDKSNIKEHLVVNTNHSKHKRKDSKSSTANNIKNEGNIHNKLPSPKVNHKQKIEQSPQENKLENDKKYNNSNFSSFSAKAILTKIGKNKDKQNNSVEKIDEKNEQNSEEFNQQNLNKELLEAAKKGKSEDIEKLINLGADINYTDQDGNTPIILAVTSKNNFSAETLLKLGADIKQNNKAGYSALDKADDSFKLLYSMMIGYIRTLKNEFYKQIITVCQQNEQQNEQINKLEEDLKKLEIIMIKEGVKLGDVICKLKETNFKNRELIVENEKLRNEVTEVKRINQKFVDLNPNQKPSENKLKIIEDKNTHIQTQLFKLTEQIHIIEEFLFKTNSNYEEVVAVDGSTIIVQPLGEHN